MIIIYVQNVKKISLLMKKDNVKLVMNFILKQNMKIDVLIVVKFLREELTKDFFVI